MEPTTEPVAADQDRTVKEGRRFGSSHVVVGLVALAIGAAAGFGVGWKVEQDRAEDDIKNTRPIGTVIAVDDNSVTLRLTNPRRRQEFVITDATVFSTATSSDASDVVEGARVLVRNRGGDDGLEAVEIVVLPDL